MVDRFRFKTSNLFLKTIISRLKTIKKGRSRRGGLL